MARQYAVLNPNALGPGLELEQGGLVVTSNTPSLDIHRLARGTIGKASGKAFFEVTLYGDGALLNLSAVGIVRATHSLQKYPGEQTTGWGLKVGNGGIFNNNASSVSTPAVDKQVFIGVLLDMDALTCTWFVNGSKWGSVTVANATWYPAITVAATVAYDLRAFVNFGQYAFAYPQDGTTDKSGIVSEGWYSTTSGPNALYLCPKENRGFTTGPLDSVPLICFVPRIKNANGFSIARRCSVWPWGGSNSGSSFGNLEIDNSDGFYDSIISQDWRDQLVRVVMLNAGDAYDDGQIVATAVVDKLEAIGEDGIRFSLKDRITTLDRPLQRKIFPPFVDAGVATRPLPMTFGACRNVAPILYDQVNRKYRMHDAAITNITAVRDKGARLDPHSAPPQYVPTNSLQGLILQTLPVGLLTCDLSSQGSQVIIPGADDVFNGEGLFTTWPVALSPPPNWTATIGGTGALTRTTIPQNYVASLSTTHAFNPVLGTQFGSHLRYDGVTLAPGKTYRINFKLVLTNGSPSTVTGGMSYGLMVRTDLTALASGAVTPNFQPLQTPLFGINDESYTFEYTVPAGAARKLYFIATSSTISNGNGNGSAEVRFYGIQVELLGDVSQSLPLQGITLKQYFAEIFMRAGVPDSDWVKTDCEDIDAATGALFGVHIPDPLTVSQALRIPLDSVCATLFTDNLGRYRVRRLIDPATVDDGDIVAEFDQTNSAYGVQVATDLAPGLTSSIGVRRNWKVFGDADFVTDYFAVPAALRTQFKRQYQFVQNSAYSPSPSYSFAMSASPLPSMFDTIRAGQVEIDRVFYPYTAGRIRADRTQILTVPRFASFRYQYVQSGDEPTLLFGDVVRMTYDRFGFDAGQKLAIKDLVLYPFISVIDITTWGSE